MTHASKLGLALRKKFTTPRDALRALGLDENFLSGAPGGDNPDALKKMRIDVENALSELDLGETQIGKILETLDKHAPFDRLDDNDPNAGHARELAGDDKKLEKFGAFLCAAGLSDNDVDEAMRLATGGGGRLSDRPQAMDAAAEARFERMFPEAARIISESPIADRRPTMRGPTTEEMERFEKMFPEAARIGINQF